MNKKSGVTMVIIVATVIIAILILSVSVVSINNATKNAAITSFTEEIVNIENEISKYYLLTGELPTLDNIKYNESEVSNISSNPEEFIEEIHTNNESENTYFVKVDLSKLNFEKSTRGLQKNGENDIYVVSYPELNVYYLTGVEIENTSYFSLAKLNKNINVQNGGESENITSLYSGDLYVKKTNNNWSNKFNIEISTFISEGQNLVVNIPQADGNKISSNLTVENNKTNFIKLNNLIEAGFSQAQASSFNELAQENKKVTIIKQSNEGVLGQVEVDLSNYDYTIPTYSTQITKESQSQYNKIKFDVSDTLSGIDKVKYEYYKKLDDGIDAIYYQDENIYEEQYILKSGKTAEIIDGEVNIKIPKNVTAIKYVISDKSGNTTGVLELDTKYLVHIKYKTISGTANSVTFDASVDSKETVTDFLTAISIDGTNYTSDYSHGAIIDLNNFTYTDIESIYDYVFVRITVKTSSITEKRIVQVDTSDFIKEGTNNKAEASWNNPYIPEGFIHTTGNVRTGFVIQDVSNTDNKYNEFVWVPVEYIYDNTSLKKSTDENKTKLQRLRIGWETSKDVSTTADLADTYVEPYSLAPQDEISEYNAMISSVKKYGGFYVSRYEAGDINATAKRTIESPEGKLVCRKNVYLYNYIVFANSMTDLSGGAVELSRNLYKNSSDIKSHLIYGSQWDSIMHWANMEGKNVSSSNAWGNYEDSIGNASNGAGEANMTYTTGKNNAWITNNIYDIAGNNWEFTMECNGDERITRGGSYIHNGAARGASRRSDSSITSMGHGISFRPVLYITE